MVLFSFSSRSFIVLSTDIFQRTGEGLTHILLKITTSGRRGRGEQKIEKKSTLIDPYFNNKSIILCLYELFI